MNVFLTFDYELFFGPRTGTVEKCMIRPAERLLELARKHKAPMTFFVDIGYVIALEKHMSDFPELQQDHQDVTTQIRKIVAEGSDVQLHIHPHWEKAVYDRGRWNIRTEGCYKLSDFPQPEIERIVRSYKARLDGLSGKFSHTFRAGGWCIQPFSLLEKIFRELGLKYDTSVFPSGHFEAGEYAFDFRKAPRKSQYPFQNDVCIEAPGGYFTEYTIGSYRYSPLFYWKLYILGRLNPKDHKMVGDGIFMSQPGRKQQVLTQFTWNHASTDGFYATKMRRITEIALAKKDPGLVFIGHPKSCTEYSFAQLDRYLARFSDKCHFQTFGALP